MTHACMACCVSSGGLIGCFSVFFHPPGRDLPLAFAFAFAFADIHALSFFSLALAFVTASLVKTERAGLFMACHSVTGRREGQR